MAVTIILEGLEIILIVMEIALVTVEMDYYGPMILGNLGVVNSRWPWFKQIRSWKIRGKLSRVNLELLLEFMMAMVAQMLLVLFVTICFAISKVPFFFQSFLLVSVIVIVLIFMSSDFQPIFWSIFDEGIQVMFELVIVNGILIKFIFVYVHSFDPLPLPLERCKQNENVMF